MPKQVLNSPYEVRNHNLSKKKISLLCSMCKGLNNLSLKVVLRR